jgi:O-antigen/teichoic acid export membrane protein
VAFYALVAICMAIAGLSLHSIVAVKWLDRSRAQSPASYTGTAIWLSLGSTILAVVASATVAPRFYGLSPAICACAAALAGANALQAMRFGVWQSREMPMKAGGLQVSSAVLNISASLIGVIALEYGASGRIGGATLAGLAIAIFSIYSLRSDGSAVRPQQSETWALLRFGIPLMPHVLAGAMLGNIDRIAISSVIGPKELGIYGTAAQLGAVMSVLADAAVKAYTPLMYRLLSRRTTRARLSVVGLTYLSIPAWFASALLLWLFFRLIGPLLLGADFHAAIDFSIWFFAAGALTGIYLNIAGLFFFAGKTEWLSLATMTSACASLLLTTQAVVHYGVTGAAAAFVSSQAIMLGLAWVLSTRTQPMPWGQPVLAVRTFLRLVRTSEW